MLRFKSLRSKLLFFMAVGALLLFALLFTAAHSVLLDGYSDLEKKTARVQVNSATSLINEQSKQLSGVISEYAHWDDMYQYMAKPDAKFTETNFNDSTFKNLNLEAVFIVNAAGETVYKRGFDSHIDQPWPIPELIERATNNGGTLVDISKKSNTGLFWTPQGVCIIATSDILATNGNGARQGTLIFVRYIDKYLEEDISQIVRAKLTFGPISAPQFAQLKPALINNELIITPLNERQLASYQALVSLNDDAKLVLNIVSDRPIYQQEQSSQKFLYWSAAMIITLLAAYGWLLDHLVLRRLARISKNVKRIGESASISDRVEEFGGHDEMARLVHGINGMLNRLDESQQALHFEKIRAQATLAGIADAVITSDNAGVVLYMNAAAEQLIGLDSSAACGKSLRSLFHLMTEDTHTLVDSTWLSDADCIQAEVLLARADGQEFILSKSASPLYDQNGRFATVTVLHDITLLRSLSNQLSHQARHDQLTGLANRYEFELTVQAAIQSTADENSTHCLAFIDLDRFKVVNDTCGHQAGDLLLKQLTDSLKAKVRNTDLLARIGGDEFALLLKDCNLDKAQELADDMLQTVRTYRFACDNNTFRVGASIGLTELSPSYTPTMSELMQTVDTACYSAKKEGGNRIHVYRPNNDDMQERNNQLEWVARIHTGLEQKQFVLYMQHIQGLHANAEPHCELLLRMRGKHNELYLPGSFIPSAERYHLMPQIDRWVVAEALAIIVRKGPEFTAMCAINLSTQSLTDKDFLNYIISQIEQNGVNANRLCFEVAETAVITNLGQARRFVRALRNIGCRFSLDNFGGGLSSFAYIKKLEVDFLKIDGMFIQSIASNAIDRAVVESINKVGHIMGLQTIAECVENDALIHTLKEIGIDYVQGYGVAMPQLFE